MLQMEPFSGLSIDDIHLVQNAKQAADALKIIRNAETVGFDTEAKPTFRKGEKSTGPHLFQFATRDKAYLFQTRHKEVLPTILDILTDPNIHKVGFGLRGDRSQIANKFGIQPNSMDDLDHEFKKLGYRNSLGVKSAIGLLTEKRFTKSKSATTSNWAAAKLSNRQLIYAANDAYAALCVHEALKQK